MRKNEKIRFDGRVVIITGSGNGIGREYALLLAKLGAKVLVNDYGGDTAGNRGDSSAADKVVQEIESAGGEALADSTDVSQECAGEEIVSKALDKWGRIDALINNAGATRGGISITDATDSDFEMTLGIHLGGTYRLTRAVWPHMVKQGFGRIVNTSSDSLWGAQAPTYVTAKSAIFGFTRSIATEGKPHNIFVNTVMPSAWTRMTADIPPSEFRDTVEKNFKPENVAPMVALMAHESFSHTGEAFQVGANRAARIFLGVTPGYQTISDHPVDELADNLEQIMDKNGWVTPKDMIDSVDVALSFLQTKK